MPLFISSCKMFTASLAVSLASIRKIFMPFGCLHLPSEISPGLLLLCLLLNISDAISGIVWLFNQQELGPPFHASELGLGVHCLACIKQRWGGFNELSMRKAVVRSGIGGSGLGSLPLLNSVAMVSLCCSVSSSVKWSNQLCLLSKVSEKSAD